MTKVSATIGVANRSLGATLSGLTTDVSAGAIIAILALSYALSYAALIFGGSETQAYLADGVAIMLTSTWVIGLVVALTSSYVFTMAGPDSNAAAVLAAAVPPVVAELVAQGASQPQSRATILTFVAVGACLCGVAGLVLGLLRQGRLARFLPYPVGGGFLAGTGYLVTAGGFKVLSGKTLSWTTVGAAWQVPPVAWIVAIAVMAGLLFAPWLTKHFLLTPVVLLAGSAAFYLGLRLTNVSIEAARQQDMLFQPIPPLGGPAYIGLARDVRWDVLLSQWHGLLALVAVVVITTTLNSAGLELATREDVDFNRELRSAGLANLAAGVLGGSPGNTTVSRSLLSRQAGARSRIAGVFSAAVCFVVGLFFAPALAFLPRPVLAGLLGYLGITLLRQWLWATWFKLPRGEYALVLAITLVIMVSGPITGIGLGLLAAALLFVYHYSRIQSVRHTLSSATHASNRERSPTEMRLLKERGDEAHALCLQGYMFFGTAAAIVDSCRSLVEDQGVRFVLLDFRLVQGTDASGVAAFGKLGHVCARNGARLLLTGLSEDAERLFKLNGVLPAPEITVFPDLDRGFEWIEEQLLAGDSLTPTLTSDQPTWHMNELLQPYFSEESIKLLREYVEARHFQPGEALFRRGDVGDDLFLIESGGVSVMLESEDGPRRLRSFGPGTVVGEMAVYTRASRSADVVADTPCVTWKLPGGYISLMEKHHPTLANEFHTFVVKLMAARLAAANEELRALL